MPAVERMRATVPAELLKYCARPTLEVNMLRPVRSSVGRFGTGQGALIRSASRPDPGRAHCGSGILAHQVFAGLRVRYAAKS